jgi:flagellar biosynthetic protein FliS
MRGLQQYKTTALETAPSETLLLMLIEAALERQDQAIEAIDLGDKASALEHLAKAREIFSELMVNLDHETAPQITAQLQRLYVWCIRELAKAGSEQDPERVRGVHRITASLLETWSEAIEATT